jgi:hypothetical protein
VSSDDPGSQHKTCEVPHSCCSSVFFDSFCLSVLTELQHCTYTLPMFRMRVLTLVICGAMALAPCTFRTTSGMFRPLLRATWLMCCVCSAGSMCKLHLTGHSGLPRNRQFHHVVTCSGAQPASCAQFLLLQSWSIMIAAQPGLSPEVTFLA